jgi:hypothetical protein
MEKNRREVLKVLGLTALGSFALAHEGHDHGAQPGMGMAKGDLVPLEPIPWDATTCAFCDMPIATPKGSYMGRTFQPGFFEQTYSQIAFKEPRKAPHSGEMVKALHFESIACMVNYAWVYGIADGDGSTFYVTDRKAYDPARPRETVRLIPAREAVFYWGEKMMVVMNARLLAFAKEADARAFAEANKAAHGRQALYRFQTLWDLAPLPEANLVGLLARHAGLLK